jgi:tetratricopeptide (TPR) repeat protein
MRPALRLAALILGLSLSALTHAQTDDIQNINRLVKQGQHAQALDRVNQYLATRPRDAQGRFLKGLILAEQNKVADAIDVFSRLTQDYPELPEPYNNLAVLYAGQGQYEKARQSLEMSIRTHPSYATAYENLGDVYTKLASQSYDKALQLDSSNTAAKTKLSLVRELISGVTRPPRLSARGEPVKPGEAARPTAIAAAPASNSTESKPAVETKAAAETKPAAAKAPEAQSEKAGTPEDAIKTVHAWAAAWAKKDVDAYLAFYAPDFKTPKGEPRGAWEKGRRQRILAPKHIEVSVDAVKVKTIDGSSATVSFRQRYRSDTIKADSGKTLVMVRVSGKWLIQQERVGN